MTTHSYRISDRSLRLIVALLALAGGLFLALLVHAIPSTAKVLVLVMGLVAAVATTQRIEWGLLALIWMTYTRFSDVMVDNGAPSTAQPFIALLLGVIALRWFLYGERPERWGTAALLIALYGAIGLATMLYAEDTGRVQYGFISYVKDALIAVIVVAFIRSPQTLRRSVWALLAAGIFLGTLTTIQQLTGTFDTTYWGFARASVQNIVGSSNDYRIAGPIGDPNFYAQILLVLVPLALDRLWSNTSRIQWVFAGWALVVCGVSIIFTFSRGAFVSLALALGLMFIRRPPAPLTSILALLLIVPLLQLMPAGYFDRLSTIFDLVPGLSDKSVKEEYSFRGRSSAQIAGWLMFRDHPIQGVGVGNYPVHYQDYSRTLGIDSSRWDQAPHNLYLEILTERGLIGLTVFLFLLWVMYRGMQRARRDFTAAEMDDEAGLVHALQIGMLAYLLAAIFLQASYPRFFWLLVGIAFAAPNVADRALTQLRTQQALSKFRGRREASNG